MEETEMVELWWTILGMVKQTIVRWKKHPEEDLGLDDSPNIDLMESELGGIERVAKRALTLLGELDVAMVGDTEIARELTLAFEDRKATIERYKKATKAGTP